jgi:hypothetical protein
MNDDDPDLHFLEAEVSLSKPEVQSTTYKLRQGGAVISIPNDIHTRLIETAKMPKWFKVIAPYSHVAIKRGKIPAACVKIRPASYYQQLNQHYTNLQLLESEAGGTSNFKRKSIELSRKHIADALETVISVSNNAELRLLERGGRPSRADIKMINKSKLKLVSMMRGPIEPEVVWTRIVKPRLERSDVGQGARLAVEHIFQEFGVLR